MGASLFAFTPSRFAVFVEGGADASLLPTALRESLGVRALGFQVVPGLSEVASTTAGALDLEAARVAYVVDSDRGGAGIAKKLRRAGIPAEKILALGDGSAAVDVLEDVLAPNLYAAAINEELRRRGGEYEVTAEDLSAPNRPLALKTWCQARGIEPPNKHEVVKRLLEQRVPGQPLLCEAGRVALVEVHAKVAQILGTPAIDDAIR